MRKIYWTCSKEKKKEIMDYFDLEGTAFNGETRADDIPEFMLDKLIELEEEGFLQIRNKQ